MLDNAPFLKQKFGQNLVKALKASQDKSEMMEGNLFRDQDGFSLIEVMVAIAIFGVAMAAFMTMQTQQTKTNNFIQFQLKRTELQGAIIGQFLNDPKNCACLFQNAGPAEIPANAAGIVWPVSTPPTELGRYQIPTPGDCTTASIPVPLVNEKGVDGIKSTSIRLRDVTATSGVFSGHLVVDVQSKREVLGVGDLSIKIPVHISVAAGSPGQVVFKSCSLATPPSPVPVVYEKKVTTINDVNNAGGVPCHNACGPGIVNWITSCASRYCQALGPEYVGGFAQEWNCAAGFGGQAVVLCIRTP